MFPGRVRRFIALLAAISFHAIATPDLKFDVVTFCCGCAGGSICQDQFDHLNWPTTNGHYIAMGTDAHRMELATNGNLLAFYYDKFNDGWPTNTGPEQAARIDQKAIDNFTSTGSKPDWAVLNEISSSLWTGNPSYRLWVHDVVHSLKNDYGYNVILYAPFSNPGANSSDWQAVGADCYIGIENYLSGTEVMSNSFSVSYCSNAYQSSITSYTNRGVARDKLMLGEHFGQTLSGIGYGRSGVASNDWDKAIVARSQAALKVNFKGFLSYSWGGTNALQVSDDERNHFEDTYRTNPLPTNPGLTAPYIIIQPQDQTVPTGGDVTFLVWRAGIGPMTFQWRFNGTNISGATTSALTLTNLDASKGGNYSVRLTNSAGSLVSSNALLLVQVPDPVAFEPFAPAITTYTPGANLIGQTNSAGQYWTQAGPTPIVNQPTIQSDSLSFPGLAPSSGNSVKFGGNGTSARFNIGTNTAAGTWFYSFVFQLGDISTLNSSGVFWAGFNNSSGTQTTTPSTVHSRVVTRSATGGYNLGLDKSFGSAAGFVFATNVFATSDTIFVVASYAFDLSATSNDVAQMWINPDPSMFGLADAPPATLTNYAGSDITGIASFVFFNRNANEPAIIYADELRVGESWASVTPPDIVQVIPTLTAARAGTNVVLSWTTNASGFTLQAASALGNSNLWSNVSSPVSIIGSQYVVTNGIGGTNFYRLRR